jgi:hypothetical protein
VEFALKPYKNETDRETGGLVDDSVVLCYYIVIAHEVIANSSNEPGIDWHVNICTSGMV